MSKPYTQPIPFLDLTDEEVIQADAGFYEAHELAEIFPPLEGEPYYELLADVEVNGLVHPIIIFEEAILDGRNRYAAWAEALQNGFQHELRTRKFPGNRQQALDYVISSNLKRRHLNETQRSMVGEKIRKIVAVDDQRPKFRAPLRSSNGEPEPAPQPTPRVHKNPATVAAAKVMNVSPSGIEMARKVYATGSPELIKQTEAGRIPVSLAEKIARMPVEQQNQITKLPEKDLPGAVKKVRRAVREKDLGEATRAASTKLGSELYNVIYADPPWRFEPRSRDTGMDRAADNHYQTMTLEEIMALKIPASQDSVLFLWATAPMLPQALMVMEYWGFDYKSHMIWDKQTVITGYWFRFRHELLLVGVKGDVPAPAPGDQWESLLSIKATKHSEKPFAFMEMIDELYPSASKIEMFARGADDIAGWDRWGNMVTEAVA